MATERTEPAPFAKLLTDLELDAAARSQSTDATFVPSRPHTTEPNLESLPRLAVDDGRVGSPELAFSGVLGEGGRGEVRLAKQLSLRRSVAVKSLKAGAAAPTAELLQEARVTGTLEHPNIVPVYALGRDAQDRVLLVMRKVDGVPWGTLLRQGAVPRSDAELEKHLDIFRQVCNAVEFAHSRGVVHRDLKSDNVMIGAFGEVVVLDWGLAVSLEGDAELGLPPARTFRGLAGTPAYMAPELVEGDGAKLGPWTDIYLLGAILHEIIAGRPPHAGPELDAVLAHAHASVPPQYEPGIPGEAAEVARKAMAADPRARFASVAELRQAVHGFLRHRHSGALAAEAEERLAALPTLASASQELLVDARAAIAQASFGFSQALKSWPESPRAQAGAQRAAAALVELELSQDNLAAAEHALAALPRSDAELTGRVAALRERLRVRDAELDNLRSLERNLNPELGAGSRNLFLVGTGLVWFVLPLVMALLERAGRMSFTYAVGGWMWLFFAVSTLAGALVARSARANWISQRFFAGMLVVVFAAGLVRLAGFLAGISVRQQLATELLTYSLAAACVATFVDIRFIPSAVVYAVGGILAAWKTEAVLFISAVTNLLALVPTAAAWRYFGRQACEDSARRG